jgi:hypothetical protein|tara:strand:+ start:117 stop:320 length:204 start_codon:yes stop_codon:yes gene_type:complete
MQTLKMISIETLAQFITDNLINLLLVYIATFYFGISLKTTTSLWLIGQSLNIFKTFLIRYYFNKAII